METKQMYIVGAVIVIALVVYFYWYNKSYKEPYLASGGLDQVGSLLDDQYDLLQAPDAEIPAANFADLVDGGDHIAPCAAGPPAVTGKNLRPMERLHRIQGESLLPKTSINVTPYNIDLANPTSHAYMVNAPRVSTALKSKYKDYSLSGFIRGDVPITYNPNVPLISKTHQGRDDLRLDGLFTPAFVSLYNKYTGRGFKNMPMQVAGSSCAG
ncbi:hypothetical protein OAG24_00400, partial [bacterium]|nr:hypothetical protein [bacterium]